MIHGRFQPFHYGHLDCLQWLAESADRLLVGITNPDDRDKRLETVSPHRHLDAANPFSYLQRMQMVTGAVADLGLTDRFVGVIPFFLTAPDVWDDYFPRDCVHFVTVLSDWEAKKAAMIVDAGYRVVVREKARDLSATEVRLRLADGLPVSALVPPSTARVIAEASK